MRRLRYPSLVVGSLKGLAPDTDTPLELEYEPIQPDIPENRETSLSLMRHRSSKVYVVLKKHKDPGDALYEAHILRSIQKHRRIVQLINVYDDEDFVGGCQILLEYCRGGHHLGRFYKRFVTHKAQVPEAMLWHVYTQLAEGLQWLHKICRVIHRDIRPRNVLVFAGVGVNGYPDIKITNFAKACEMNMVDVCHLDEVTNWQPPETNHSTASADVWAAGATVHYLALGVPPIEKCIVDPKSVDHTAVAALPKQSEQYLDFERYVLSINNVHIILEKNEWLEGYAQPYSTELDSHLGRALTRRHKRATADYLVRAISGPATRRVADAEMLPKWARST